MAILATHTIIPIGMYFQKWKIALLLLQIDGK